MCDTVAFPAGAGGTTMFGKNSDREPGEPQLIQYVTPDTQTPDQVHAAAAKPAYVANSLPTLRDALAQLRSGGGQSFGALISRPSWMWGAEMGVNEAGLAVGNEAVFSRRRSPGKPLLGMDILRLCLHYSATAAEGAALIDELVSAYGQGGDGGWKHKTEYSNSYLLQDASEAWLVETSGSRVRSRRSDVPVGISNTYDPGKGWQRNPGMKRGDERPLIALGAQAARRNRLKAPWLTARRPMGGPQDMFALLRTHGSADGEIRRGMGSLCIHTGRLIKSESTASLVVQWSDAGPVAWATGSSWPCLSIYKPYLVGAGNPEITCVNDEIVAREIRLRREVVGRWAGGHPIEFSESLRPLRDEAETRMRAIMEASGTATSGGDRSATTSPATPDAAAAAVKECHEIEAQYLARAEEIMSRDATQDRPVAFA